MTLKFFQYGADKLVATLELDETKSSIIDKLNEPTRLSATLTSDTAPALQLGARTTYKGVTYYVTKEPTVRKEHSKLYTIETELETVIGLARHVILDNPVDKRSSFDYTATATEHIQLVVDSLNDKKLSKVPAWTRGLILASNTVKHIKYDGISAWDALQLIRQTYETDLHIDGTAIALGIWGNKVDAIELAYGKDNGILSGLERIKHDDTPTPMCLYVTGTKRNMTKGRLTMQHLESLKVDSNGTIYHGDTPNVEGRMYGTDRTGQYISEFTHDNGTQPLYTEATYTNEEIYPSHVSTIKVVTKVKDHYEVNSDFDYSKLLIEGEQMQVVFQTGNLAGRDFDAKYYSGTGRLAIVPKEEDDTTLPSDILCPKVGDQYIVTGIKLPDQYITEAQRKLTEDALSHLLKLQQQRYSYKAEIDPVYLHNHKTTIGTKLDVGQYVHLTDQQIAVGDPYIRIIAKRTYLDRPYTPEIELSNEVERLSLFERIVRDVDGMRIDRDEMIDRLRNNGMALDSLVVTSGDISERLKTAEEALTGKLDSGAFSQWQAGDLAKALASKQPVGSYALTSQLATSQQQAVDEAVKQAEEMDKQIKVGGRNLIRNSDKSLSNNLYYVGRYEISDPSLMVAGEDYTIQIWGEIDGADFSESIWVYNSGGNTEVANIQKLVNGVWQMTFKWKDDSDKQNHYLDLFRGANHPNNKNSYNTTITRIKLERGTVATDWTPAPEDVEESVTSLESKLLDPQQGEIHKLTSQLESHKTATDKSFAELSDHPLTIDQDGYWRIWNLKQQQYVTTQYQSRGRDGGKGDKGDKPVITLNNKYQLLADGELVSPQSLKGADGHNGTDGQDGAKGADGKDGHSPSPEEVLSTDSFRQRLTSEVTTQVTPVSQRIDAVKETVDQNSTDLATANSKIEEVKKTADKSLSGVDDLSSAIQYVAGEANRANQGVSDLKTFETSATRQLTDLDQRSFSFDQKRDLGYLTNALQVLRSAGNTLEGLALQRIIALSGDNQTVSAYLASNAMPAVLKAGITNFGTPQEREQVAITHAGTGHIGNLYFAGDTIDFRTSEGTDPYLSIGAEESQFIEDFISTARLDDTPVSVSSVSLTASNAGYQRTISVDKDGTRLTINIDKVNVAVYGSSTLRLTLDGVTIAEWQGKTKYTDASGNTGGEGGGKGFKVDYAPYEASNLTYERVVRAGSHIVRLAVVNPTSGGTASVTGLRVRRRYDTGAQQSLLTKSGLRLFGSPDRYLDVDYRPTYRADLGNGRYYNLPNPYLVRIKGGAKVDKLTADELDVPGVPLCGASFNENGGQIKAFGKYANKRGSTRAQAEYDNGMAAFKVYHSIGHTNYIPIVQVSGWASNNINWALTPRVYNITSEYFVVRILTNNDNPTAKAISYVAYKTQ